MTQRSVVDQHKQERMTKYVAAVKAHLEHLGHVAGR